MVAIQPSHHPGVVRPYSLTVRTIIRPLQQKAPTERGRRLDHSTIVIKGDDPPDWFDDEQLKIWRHAILCAPPGVLCDFDQETLISYTLAAALRKAASEAAR